MEYDLSAANAKLKFQTMTIISVLISIIGYIALLVCSYVFQTPGLGFGLYMIFFFIAAAFLAISLNITLNRMGAETNGIWKCSSITVSALLFTFFLALPIGIGRDAVFPNWPDLNPTEYHVINWQYVYSNYIPSMILMWLGSVVIIYLILRRKLSNIESWLFKPVRNGFKMGLFQLCFLGFCAFFELALYGNAPDFRSYATYLSHICLGLAAVVMVVYIILTKGSRVLLLSLGLRNLLLLFPAIELFRWIQTMVTRGFDLYLPGTQFGMSTMRVAFLVTHHGGYGKLHTGSLIFTFAVLLIYAALKYTTSRNAVFRLRGTLPPPRP
jgi:hypothetical protein